MSRTFVYSPPHERDHYQNAENTLQTTAKWRCLLYSLRHERPSAKRWKQDKGTPSPSAWDLKRSECAVLTEWPQITWPHARSIPVQGITLNPPKDDRRPRQGSEAWPGPERSGLRAAGRPTQLGLQRGASGGPCGAGLCSWFHRERPGRLPPDAHPQAPCALLTHPGSTQFRLCARHKALLL